jgi:hypothetical protein
MSFVWFAQLPGAVADAGLANGQRRKAELAEAQVDAIRGRRESAKAEERSDRSPI